MATIWKTLVRPVFWLSFVFLGGLLATDLIYLHSGIHWIVLYLLVVTVGLLYAASIREVSAPVRLPGALPGTYQTRNGIPLAELLLQEFEYIKETASQAMNDRHTMVNYFLLSAGVVFAAFGVMLSKEGGWELPYRNSILIALSLLFSGIGWVYFMQIIRLRQAWCESARAMNHLKLFYMRYCDFPENLAHQAFRWRADTIPPAGKKFTVFYFSALLIALISAAVLAVATFLVTANTDFLAAWRWGLVALLGIYHVIFQMSLYSVLLEETPAQAARSMSATFHEPIAKSPSRVEVDDERVVYDDVFRLIQAHLRFEKFDGTMSDTVRRLCFERGDAVAVVLHHPQRHTLVLVEQFRYPVFRAMGRRNGWLYELVAGTVEAGETPEEVARREVLEETGYQLAYLEPLASIFPSPGGASERIFLFYGQLGERKEPGGGAPAEHEDIRVVECPVEHVLEMVSKGQIQDAKTLVGLFFAMDRLTVRKSPTK